MMPGQTQPFLYPGMYNPGQFAFSNNAEMSQLISMFAMPLLGQMAGPGNFMPHMMPGQALFDQFTMRNYQQQQQAATYALAGAQNNTLSSGLLGLSGAFTNGPITGANRSQAATMAGILNNPMVKSVMGMALGPENVEAMLHGSKGDIQNLGAAVNRMGYFRRDPSGGGRMDAHSLEDLTTGVFSHLYEPQGDTKRMAAEARSGDRGSLRKLQEAARMEDRVVVSDSDIETRLRNQGDSEVDRLYKKYVRGGTATDAATQASELTKFDRAIKESGVLHGTEASVGMLQSRANRVPVDEMHGFMSGQVSQLMENLAQRGVLPPSVGSLSTKDRVGAIAETKLDDATLDRMAQKMAQRDLEGSDTEAGRRYREAADDTERQKELDAATGRYRDSIRSTKEEADKYARGESTKSAEEILQSTGGEALAGNVDASRSANKLKEYTEALSAVRDIFGDNGNPNAPMPALMAALDQLTQGGMGQMKPAQMASTLRQMQTLARETGTGMQQLAQMSAVAGNLGQQLGIAPSITMQNVAATMGITKAAMDSGAFSTGTFGTMGKEQFQMQTMQMLQEGDASGNAKSMAALARIYEMDPDRFKGTELEAAMAAYNDPNSDGTYTFKDPKTGQSVTRNIYEDIGKGRQFAAQDLLISSGGTQNDFYAAVYDPLTQQFARAGAGYMTQKHERIQTLSAYSTEGALRAQMAGTDTLAGMNDAQITSAGEVITGMILDSADMGPKQQVDYLQNHMKDRLKEHFVKQGKSEEEAAKMADEMSQKMVGDKSAVNRLLGNVGQTAQHFYNQNLAAMSQQYGHNRDVYGMLEVGDAKARSDAQKRMIGYESTVGQRAADYLIDIGERGENFNLDQFMKAMAPVIGDDEVLRQYSGEMGAGMQTMARERNKYQVTQKHIDALHEKASKGGAGAAEAQAELRRLGNVADDAVIVTNEDINREREAKIAGISDQKGEKGEESDLDRAYRAAYGGSSAHLTTEQKREALRSSDTYKTQFAKEYKDTLRSRKDGTYLTEDELRSRAMGSLGKALDGMEGNLEDIKAVQHAFENGQSKDSLRAGVDAMFRMKGLQGAFAGMGEKDRKELQEAIMTEGDSREAILKKFGLTEEQYQSGLTSETKTQQQRAAETAIALDSAHKYDMDKMAQDAAQKVEKAEIDATTVIIKADKVEGAGAGAASAAAASAGRQAPGSPIPDDIAAIDAELAAIEATKDKDYDTSWSKFFGFDGIHWKDADRKAELLKKKEQLEARAKDDKTAPKDPAETKPDKPLDPPHKPPETATSTPPGADGKMPPGTDVSQSEAARRGADAAATINAEQSAASSIPDASAQAAAAGGAAGRTSANVNPAAASSPQQVAMGGYGGGGGAGGGDAGPMTVTGKISVEGLREGVIELMGQRPLNTPGLAAAAPIVPDPPMNHVAGGAQTAHA